MNFCNVRNSSGRSTEQMESQLPLMPSPVISMQIFIVEVLFSICLGEEKEYKRDHFLLILDTQRYLTQKKYLLGLVTSPKLQTALLQIKYVQVEMRPLGYEVSTDGKCYLPEDHQKGSESSDVLKWGQKDQQGKRACYENSEHLENEAVKNREHEERCE